MEYIYKQFALRFPMAEISVTFTDDETIEVQVDGHLWTMEIGSDDDRFLFTHDNEVIAFPLEDVL